MINLAWKLALVVKSLSPPSLLDSYHAERAPVVREMLNVTHVLADATFKTRPRDSVGDSGRRGWRPENKGGP